MFRKLLKYDILSVFKLWWISAVSASVLAVVCGICIQIINVDYTVHDAIKTFAFLGATLSVIGNIAFIVVSMIFLGMRFYKHFFSDEGYLTFTLPVKKTSLLNSKLTVSMIFGIATLLVFLINLCIALAIGFPDQFFSVDTWKSLFEMIGEFFSELKVYGGIYIAEFIIGCIVYLALSFLMIYFCITVSSLLAKKHRILVAIGVYYIFNIITSTAIQIFMSSGLYRIFGMIGELEQAKAMPVVAIMGLGGIVILVLSFAALYMLQLFLLDRKLNLE